MANYVFIRRHQIAKKDELQFEIINHIGILSTSPSGWTTELNRISWNGKEPRYDLRAWAPDHTKMGKGITLSEGDIIALSEILKKEVAFLKEEE